MEKLYSKTHCDDSLVKNFHNIRKWKKGSEINTVMGKEKETTSTLENIQKKTRGRSYSKMMQRSRPLKNNEKKAIVV